MIIELLLKKSIFLINLLIYQKLKILIIITVILKKEQQAKLEKKIFPLKKKKTII